ncbi:hypothetical protein AB0P44_38840, partial [Streptomyces chartreusis]|uniref:hypothetical protein n=1 Tax=Streptomyces chartreusis TaxID=1969 RepID=UPI003430686A
MEPDPGRLPPRTRPDTAAVDGPSTDWPTARAAHRVADGRQTVRAAGGRRSGRRAGHGPGSGRQTVRAASGTRSGQR